MLKSTYFILLLMPFFELRHPARGGVPRRMTGSAVHYLAQSWLRVWRDEYLIIAFDANVISTIAITWLFEKLSVK